MHRNLSLFAAVVPGLFMAACCCKAPSGGTSGVGSTSASSAASAPPVAVVAELAISAKLAALIANPKAEKATKTETAKTETRYHYALPGTEEVILSLPLQKEQSPLWHVQIIKPAFKAAQLAPTNGSKPAAPTTAGPWLELTAGSLKDAFTIDMPDGRILIATALRAVEYADPALGPWVCANNKVPGWTHLDDSEFRVQCKELVLKQLLSPKSADFQGIMGGVKPSVTNPNCTQSWSSYVDAKNAFNVDIRKNFTCTYDPRTKLISAKID